MPAQLRLHHELEDRIHERQHALAAAEILHQRDDPSPAVPPLFGIRLENLRVRQPKPVDALLDVADQETIGPRRRRGSRPSEWCPARR